MMSNQFVFICLPEMVYYMFNVFSVLFTFALVRSSMSHNSTVGGRHPRTTAFLPLTFLKSGAVMNFVCGFGVPVSELDYETITSGIVFKSQHFLPGSSSNLRNSSTTNIHGRKNDNTRKYQSAKVGNYRWFFYNIAASFLDGLGYSGKACILRAICDAAAVPIHTNDGLLSEVLNILLTPTVSNDGRGDGFENEYFKAERLGAEGEATKCALQYNKCSRSILEYVSTVLSI